MKKDQIQIGGRYLAKVSGRLTTVCIMQANPISGWDAINKETGRGVRVKTAARLRRPVKPQ